MKGGIITVQKESLMNIEKVDAVWQEYLMFVAETRSKLNMFQSSLTTAFGYTLETKKLYAIQKTERDLKSSTEDVADELLRNLISFASLHFSKTGGKLDIPVPSYNLENNGVRRPLDEVLNLKAVWAKLESTYGGENGAIFENKQTATNLIQALRLSRNDSVRRVAGWTVCDREVYVETHYTGTHKRFTTSSKSSIEFILLALGDFARGHNHVKLAEDLKNSPLLALRHEVVSREQFMNGDNQLKFVTYLKNIEIHFSPELAEEFQIFLAPYLQKEPA